jgi:hypothetical protein
MKKALGFGLRHAAPIGAGFETLLELTRDKKQFKRLKEAYENKTPFNIDGVMQPISDELWEKIEEIRKADRAGAFGRGVGAYALGTAGFTKTYEAMNKGPLKDNIKGDPRKSLIKGAIKAVPALVVGVISSIVGSEAGDGLTTEFIIFRDNLGIPNDLLKSIQSQVITTDQIEAARIAAEEEGNPQASASLNTSLQNNNFSNTENNYSSPGDIVDKQKFSSLGPMMSNKLLYG